MGIQETKEIVAALAKVLCIHVNWQDDGVTVSANAEEILDAAARRLSLPLDSPLGDYELELKAMLAWRSMAKGDKDGTQIRLDDLHKQLGDYERTIMRQEALLVQYRKQLGIENTGPTLGVKRDNR